MFEIKDDLSKTNIPKTIRFTETLDARLKAVSEEHNLSFNNLVLQCCQYALDNMNPKTDK